ncbi:chondroitinase-B domain-containing protein [Haloferula sp.]|uniref:chondroitinase-B domain-containing protein n=1 Tax=Haloferula sp. TaxID=2497595 RepID=UPI00329D3FA0
MTQKPTRMSLVTALVVGTLSMTPSLRAVTHNVSNASEFNSLPTLNAGDVVVMASGTYGALDTTLVSSISSDATALSNPIYVTAAVAGGVNVSAPSLIELEGRGIILAGLDFVSGSGMKDNGSTSPASLIKTKANSRYMTISNIRVLNCTDGDDYGHWLNIEGFHHTIEYCSFEGKDLIGNATVGFKRSTSEAGISTPRDHVMRYCYFGPRECSTSDNGYETIRIGDSSSQAHDMQVTIEENVFYRAIWNANGDKPNDMEIISNKTKGNIIRNNTFLESYGQITLRHGDACTVEGNYIIGGGYYSGSSILRNAANSYQSGIRVIGQDHVVRNNYLENLNATGFRAAICVMGGESSWNDGDGSGGDNGYEPAHGTEVYNNTLIDCREWQLGFLSAGSVQPTGVQVYNNAWQGSGSDNGIVQGSSFSLGGSGGNYIYHPSSDYGWTGLGGTYSSSTSPDVTESFDNYNIPSSSSPLLGGADLTLSASDDVRKLSRPASGRDIGCFEREVAGSGIRPLLRNEVGPEFDGGPSGTYPVLGDTTPIITTTTLPSGNLTVAYSEALNASAGDPPLTWSVSSGSLPAGITLSSSGILSGTPTSTGTSNFTVMVTDDDNDADTQLLSLIINSEPGSEPAKFALTSTDVTADTDNAPYVAANTLDGNTDPESRWSALGDGEWIRYDLGGVKEVHHLNLAFYKGNERSTTFDIEVSDDDTNWTPVVSGVVSADDSLDLETYDIPDTLARYVRVVGHGNSSPSLWNSITETEIWGLTPVAPDTPGNLAVTPSDEQVSVSWDASTGATTYHLKRSTVSGSGYSTIASVSGTSHLDTSVTNGTTYYYVISAESTSGESADSTQVSAKPYAPVATEELSGHTVSFSGGDAQLAIQSVAGRIYQLQWNDTLNPATWMDVGVSETGTGVEVILTDPGAATAPRRFYRISIQP